VEAPIRFNQKPWLYYALVAIAIVGSFVSLFALFKLGSPSWTIPVNVLSVVCILLAVKARGHSAHGDDE
jgi:uncharacterized membrane protein